MAPLLRGIAQPRGADRESVTRHACSLRLPVETFLRGEGDPIVRRSSIIAWSLVTVLLLGLSVVYYGKYRKYETDYARMTAQEQETQTRYTAAINEIAAIQDSLNSIAFGEDAAKLLPAQLQSEGTMSATMHDQVLTQIATIKAGLERTKTRIQDLDSRLKKNGIRLAGMQRMIDNLKQNVAQKEEQVALLDSQVASLQTQVAGLSSDVETKQHDLDDKQREIATIYYTMGTKKDLMNSGVVVSKGGVLGLGKTLKPSGQFDEANFTALNTDQETVIHIPAKEAQILSPQPLASYALEATANNATDLRILDPKEFRKIKHLVILM